MQVTVKAALTVLLLVVGGPAAAWAADTCFSDSDGNIALVGKSFTLPTAGNCKVFNGYYTDTTWPVSGNVCGTSDNSKIRFNLQYSQFRTTSDPFVAHALAYLNRATLTGAIEYVFSTGSSGTLGFGKVPCPSPRLLN